MMKVWDEVRSLEGQILKTLDQGREFDILDVFDNLVSIEVHSTGNERRIDKHQIESAFESAFL